MSSLPRYLNRLHEHTSGFNSGRKYSIPGANHTRHRSRSPIKEQKEVNAMTVKEIRMELGKAGVNYSNIIEKGELIKKLERHREGKTGGSRRTRKRRRCS